MHSLIAMPTRDEFEHLMQIAPQEGVRSRTADRDLSRFHRNVEGSVSTLHSLHSGVTRGATLDVPSLQRTVDVFVAAANLLVRLLRRNAGVPDPGEPPPEDDPDGRGEAGPDPAPPPPRDQRSVPRSAPRPVAPTKDMAVPKDKPKDEDKPKDKAEPKDKAPNKSSKVVPPVPPKPSLRVTTVPPPRVQVPFALYQPQPVPPPPPCGPVSQPPVEGIEVGAIAGSDNDREPPQGGILGIYFASQRAVDQAAGRATGPVHYMALNLNEPLALAAFGAPGSGKSYFRGVVVESLLQHCRMLHLAQGLPQPGCVISVRVGAGPKVPLDFMASAQPNHNAREADLLYTCYGARPQGLEDQVLLCLPEEVAAYRQRYPFALVLPLSLRLRDLSPLGLNGLMGIQEGKTPLYARELGLHLRELRAAASSSVADLRATLGGLHLSGIAKRLVLHRLDLLGSFLAEDVDLRSLIKPGRIIQISVSTESLLPEDARLLVALALDVLVLREGGAACPLLVDFDEAHELLKGDLLEAVAEDVLRRRRHINCGMILCTHSPRSLRKPLLTLLEVIAQFRSDDRDSLKHLSECFDIFKDLRPHHCASLADGHAWFWAQRYYQIDQDPESALSADRLQLLETRLRFSHHGGATRTAVPEEAR